MQFEGTMTVKGKIGFYFSVTFLK